MKQTVKRYWRQLAVAVVTVAALIAISTVYYKIPAFQTGIYTFEESRDLAFIIEQFKKNWYWLIPDSMTEFDVESTFKYSSRTSSPQDVGSATVKVWREHGQPRGFIAYYKENFYKGFIWFVVVDEAYRGRGYAQKLVNYALDDLKKQGATTVWMVTRTNNFIAQHVYEKAGFKEVWRDEKYIRYEREL
jgi:ribosomal protein S18 acetylase RimI-like enzyme